MSAPEAIPDPFVRGLHALLDARNRGRLAALRRGLGRPVGTPGNAAREFYRLLPSSVSPHDEPAYWTAATLFAAFPPRDGTAIAKGASVTAALRRLAERAGSGDDEVQRLGRRVLQLLDARRGALDVHLRGVASLLHAGGIALDVAVLVRDLRWWDAPDRGVQRRWAREFWRAPVASDETKEDA